MLQQLQAEGFGKTNGYMNMEQEMVEKFMSRPGQQKPTQDLLQLTWRAREDLMMGNMKSLTRCVSQIKCQN